MFTPQGTMYTGRQLAEHSLDVSVLQVEPMRHRAEVQVFGHHQSSGDKAATPMSKSTSRVSKQACVVFSCVIHYRSLVIVFPW